MDVKSPAVMEPSRSSDDLLR